MNKFIISLIYLSLWLHMDATASSTHKNYIEQKVDKKTAQAICGNEPVKVIDGQYACAACPSFIDGAIPEPMLLQKMVFGKFSKPHAKEVVVDTEGCEPHSNSFGGIILLEERNSVLTRRYYQAGYRLNECLKYESSKGRDVLVCNEIFYAQGSTIGQYAAFRFGNKEATWRELQSWIYTEDNKYAIEPAGATQTDLNNDGIQDLVLTFSAKSPKEAVKNINIKYIFDGQVFKLLEISKETKDELDKLFDQWN